MATATTTAQAAGLRNALVVGALPLAMAALARNLARPMGHSPLPTSVVFPFCALSLYAALASFWGGYQFAALKLLTYLGAYAGVLFGYVVLGQTQPGVLAKLTVWFVICALVLGVAQTFVFGNPFGNLAYRFTAFGAPQPFALGLAVLAGLLVYQAHQRRVAPALALGLLACIIVALLLCGGRQAFVAATGLCLLGSLPPPGQTRPSRAWLPVAGLVGGLVLATSLQIAGPKDVAAMLRAHPASALLFLSDANLQTSGDAGTAQARADIFRALWARIRASDAREVVFGHGTSSAAVVIAEGDVRYRNYDESSLDPNRTAHNEFLRALYEWGVVGLTLFCALLFGVLRTAYAVLRRSRSVADLVLFATAGIALVGFTLLGNSLAAMSGPLGPALCLLCAEIFRRDRELAA